MEVRVGDSFLGVGTFRRYDLARLTNLRLATKNVMQGKIEFDYGTRTISCGKGFFVAEAEQIIQYLSTMQTFRWHIVKCIVFGRPQPTIQESQTTLHNPDVTDLTFPFVRLQEIIIGAATHDFHQVERFLTYAVNYIGQEYLKAQVEVHIYGDPEQLHQNLRNSLTNLCKSVTIH